MTVRTLSRFSTDTFQICDAINQLASGRTNATGSVTLASSAVTSTTVSAVTCAGGSIVHLHPQTASAAAAMTSVYVASTDTTKGQFIIHHSSSTTTDRIFSWKVEG